MTTITDLDIIVPEDKTLKFGGEQYRVPGDMPLDTYLRVQHVQQLQTDDDITEQTVLTAMVETLVGLLAWYLPEGDEAPRDKIRKELGRRGIGALIELLGAIYPTEGDEDEGGATPDPRTPDGTPTTSSE